MRALLAILCQLATLTIAQDREYKIWDASYGNLICFSCSLDFRWKRFNGRDPCLGLYEPLNKTNLVRCGQNEIFCKEDFLTGNGVLWTVHRQCTAICYAGCRPRGFGITHTTCTRCCTKHGCNSSPPDQLGSGYQSKKRN
ncbi:uncharacterized protein LOC119098514 [Pollicipes pollicipes]|uniref:uncharacterized protein LOC119094869 n=1 Tax=Pollicipes pollicipes TaxID=41117 RepID=UPI001884B43D|nr:uncharacterized protein LOC119094869 [Pollicipes pollicipes]XP_037077397.1 uncharacterized protein LOC119098514 [Pollicipes pollicipes]